MNAFEIRQLLQVEARVADAKHRIDKADQVIHNPKDSNEFFVAIGEKAKALHDQKVWMKVLRNISPVAL